MRGQLVVEKARVAGKQKEQKLLAGLIDSGATVLLQVWHHSRGEKESR